MFQPPRLSLDALNKALLSGALVSALAMLFFPYGSAARAVFTGLLALCVLIAVFRLFSGDRERRYMENQRFLTFTTGVREFFRKPRTAHSRPTRAARPERAQRTQRAQRVRTNPTWSELKRYKYLICPQCTQRLRVPRGKGRLRVTCTRCGNKFETKS